MIPVIISGGFGTKLWPISRKSLPKQFLPLIRGKSLFQTNYEALRLKFSPDEIYISTNVDQAKIAQGQVPEISAQNYILEPEMKNQGPATGLIAATLFKKGFPDEPFMLVQVDDLREPVEEFLRMIDICDRLARSETKYITGGFKPDFRIQGVDYLMKGRRITNEDEIGVFDVVKYIWRKSVEEIESLINDGSLLVHTNHTCMTPRNFLNMIKKYRDDWYMPLADIIEGADIMTEYSKMPSGPVEEVTELVHANGESQVVELPFRWVDIGTWESLSHYYRDNNLYQVSNPVIDLDGKNNFLNIENKHKMIALVGVDNLAIVDTPDALLICSKDQSAKVGEVVKSLNTQKLTQYL